MGTIYRCATCNGPVRSYHEAFQVEVPARDERGRNIYKYSKDPETGQRIEKQVMLKQDARGLGHWSCNRGCRPCKVVATVTHPKEVV